MSSSCLATAARVFGALAVLSGVLGPAAQAAERFCAVGWYGEFTHIDSSLGQVAPTRTDLPEGMQALAWSPDGTLYAAGRGTLYTLDPHTGDSELFLTVDLDIRAMAFSKSGELYVTGGKTGTPDTLQIIDITSGTYAERDALWGDADECQGLAFAPDGRLYGVVPHDHSSGTYDLFTIDLDDSETHLLGSHAGDFDQSLVFTSDGRLYGLGPFGADRGATSSFAQLNPQDGTIVGPVFDFAGDYRGLEIVPEPATVLLLGLGGLALLHRRRRGRYV